MGFNKLDFLSNSPKNFIFQNHYNKTILGGVLTLVFLIATLLILTYYLICFITEEDYSIQYARYTKILSPEEQKERRSDNRYNPYLNCSFDLTDGYHNILPEEDFILLNETNNQIIYRGILSNKRTTDFSLISILYKCNDIKDINDIDECQIPIDVVRLQIKYNGFKLDHQNSTLPLYIPEDMHFSTNITFSSYQIMLLTESWENVKYNEEAGLTKLWKSLNKIDNEQQKYIGIIKKSSTFINLIFINQLREINGTKYRIIGQFRYAVDFNQYDEYSRTKKSFLVLISNVFSLSLGICNFLTFLLTKFYSINFDNYKIVEKVLFNVRPLKSVKFRKNELIISSINEDSLLDDNQKDNDYNNDDKEDINLGNEKINDNNEREK